MHQFRPITQQQRDKMVEIFKKTGRTFQDLRCSAVSGANDSLRFCCDHMEELNSDDLQKIIDAYDNGKL